MVTQALLFSFLVIFLAKIISCFRNLLVARKFLRQDAVFCSGPEKEVEILLLIPVLREHNVIIGTMKHFAAMPRKNIKLHICLAGTMRETAQGSAMGTGGIINAWISKNMDVQDNGLCFYYCEADDHEGDRASQLNYAVRFMSRFCCPHLIGVYDADSLPESNSLQEAAGRCLDNPDTVWQQPASFIKAANRLAKSRANPVLVANALYQSVWTMIRELPRWIDHHASRKMSSARLFWRNDYLIGHGQYLPFSVYKKFAFPQDEITDGIQLGYRLTCSAYDIAPLHSFCNDDVPQQFSQLVSQHKRWFGGCMRLISAYEWCGKHIGKSSLWPVLDGLYSQLSWTAAAPVTVMALTGSILTMSGHNLLLPLSIIMLFPVYAWLIPTLALRLFPEPLQIRLIDWLALPLAMGLKCAGPLLYIFQSLSSMFNRKKINYVKVER